MVCWTNAVRHLLESWYFSSCLIFLQEPVHNIMKFGTYECVKVLKTQGRMQLNEARMLQSSTEGQQMPWDCQRLGAHRQGLSPWSWGGWNEALRHRPQEASVRCNHVNPDSIGFPFCRRLCKHLGNVHVLALSSLLSAAAAVAGWGVNES